MDVKKYSGWFSDDVLLRLKYLKDTKKEKDGSNVSTLQINKEELVVEEQKDDGYANLKVKISHPCISFNDLEKTHWGYIDYSNVSDGLILENREGMYWIHIFEQRGL